MKKKVTFCKIIQTYNYTPDENDSFLERTNTANIIDKYTYKSDIIDIFKETMNKKFLIVYGNLGRHPYLLEYYLDIYFDSTQTVHVQSRWWNHLKMDLYYKDNETPCDMLILLEPIQRIHKPTYAKSLLVLTSLEKYQNVYPEKYLYLGNFDKIKQVLNKYTNVKRSKKPQLFCNNRIKQVLNKYTNVKCSKKYFFEPQLFCNNRLSYFNKSHVSLDLSQYQSKHEICLYILNMIDYLSNFKINSWTVVFV